MADAETDADVKPCEPSFTGLQQKMCVFKPEKTMLVRSGLKNIKPLGPLKSAVGT